MKQTCLIQIEFGILQTKKVTFHEHTIEHNLYHLTKEKNWNSQEGIVIDYNLY